MASSFSPDDKPAGSVAAFLASARLEPTREFIARRHADAQIITDDNLLSEYRDGERFGPTFPASVATLDSAIFGPLDP